MESHPANRSRLLFIADGRMVIAREGGNGWMLNDAVTH